MTELTIIVKVTIVMVVAIAGTFLLRRTRASMRHLWLACAFGIVLVLPVAALFGPPLTIDIPIAVPVAPPVAMTSPLSGASEASSTAPVSLLSPLSPRDEGRRSAFSALAWLRIGWVVGVLFFLLPIGFALGCVGRLRRTGLPWVERATLVRTLATRAGINRPVTLLLHEDVQAPATCGCLWPAILLPSDAPTWNESDIQRALVHELEHVRRADWLVHLVARLVTAVYWFHPLVWFAWRLLSLDSERACDDAVLRGAEPTTYAEQLLALARRLSSRRARPLLSMASRSDLSARVTAVLDRNRPRGRAGRLSVAAMATAAVIVALVVSPLRAVNRSSEVARQNEPATRIVASQSLTPSGTSTRLGDLPQFEVASIKVNKSGDNQLRIGFTPGGRFNAVNVPLRVLISAAYVTARPPLPNLRVVGGPDWMDAQRFDIEAATDGTFQPGTEAVLIRNLLADRFRLVVHAETRSLPVYALVRARTEGQLGPRLVGSMVDCAGVSGRGGLPGTPLRVTSNCQMSNGPGRIAGTAVTMGQLAASLSGPVDRIVLDKTGLNGVFDLNLEFTPELASGAAWVADQPVPPTLLSGPSIFTAVREQLGLILESQRGPVEVVVIDHAEQPTDNQAAPSSPRLSSSQAPSSAPAQVADEILVEVNGEAFSRRGLEERQSRMVRQRMQALGLASPPVGGELRAMLVDLTPQIIVDAVNELVVVQRGKALGYTLTDEQFQRVLGDIRRENNLDTDEKFQAALKQESLTMADLRRNLERQALSQRVQQVEAPRGVGATNSPQEILQQYLQRLRSQAVIEWKNEEARKAFEEGLK